VASQAPAAAVARPSLGGGAAPQSPRQRLAALIAEDADEPTSPPPGSDREHALRQCGLGAARQAAAEFRCPDGTPAFRRGLRRRGNAGAAHAGHIIDIYELDCEGGVVTVFADGYSCQEGRADKDAFMSLARGALLAQAREISDRETQARAEAERARQE